MALPLRPGRPAPAAKRNTAASPARSSDHFREREKIDRRAGRDLTDRLVEHDKTIGLHDRGQNAGAVFRIAPCHDGAVLAYQAGAQIFTASRLLAVGEVGGDGKLKRRS